MRFQIIKLQLQKCADHKVDTQVEHFHINKEHWTERVFRLKF
jgi:hypothetical protein